MKDKTINVLIMTILTVNINNGIRVIKNTKTSVEL